MLLFPVRIVQMLVKFAILSDVTLKCKTSSAWGENFISTLKKTVEGTHLSKTKNVNVY
jgi:hypothetical protein